MTDPETPDEAYERLLRETRLGEQIKELEGVLGETNGDRLGRAMLRRVHDGCPLHPRPTVGEHDGSTGAEFFEAAKEALGGGLELRDDMGFCVGCGSRDCTCEPAAAELGPRLRCGAFRLQDCAVDDLFADGVDCASCEPALTPPF